MVVVWSANHFYYNGELFSCLRHSSLEAIFCPPAEPGDVFGTTINDRPGNRGGRVYSVLRIGENIIVSINMNILHLMNIYDIAE